MKNKLRFLSLLALVILINFLFSFADYSFDLTSDKKYSISNETEQILSRLDDIIFVKVYLDGDLIFQSLEVINDDQLDHALNKEFKVTKETSDTISNL